MNVATEKQREDALATRDQARATVQAAQAEIANAKLNLGYTEVRAPVAGLTVVELAVDRFADPGPADAADDDYAAGSGLCEFLVHR